QSVKFARWFKRARSTKNATTAARMPKTTHLSTLATEPNHPDNASDPGGWFGRAGGRPDESDVPLDREDDWPSRLAGSGPAFLCEPSCDGSRRPAWLLSDPCLLFWPPCPWPCWSSCLPWPDPCLPSWLSCPEPCLSSLRSPESPPFCWPE